MKQIFLFLSLLLVTAMAFAKENTPILINTDEANPPFMYLRDGQAVGLYPAVIAAAFRRMKVPVDLQAKPWRRALTELDLGLAGVGGIYKNSERLKKYDYSDQIFAETLIVYFNTAEPLEYARIEDLKGKRIGVLRGWSYGDEFDNARKAGLFSAEEVSSDDQNFLKLESMRIDAAIAVSESGATLVSKFRHLRFARSPLSQKPTFLAFSKSSHRTKLLSQFDQTIRAMRKSGEFQEIVAAELAK